MDAGLPRGLISDFQVHVVEVTVVTFTYVENQLFLLPSVLIDNYYTFIVFLITFVWIIHYNGVIQR